MKRAQGKPRVLELLVVDDNPGDVGLIRETLRERWVALNVSVASDGRETMAFLRREDRFARSPRPDLILLDLNLPGKNGLETLEEIKSDRDLASIPVVMLSSSNSSREVRDAYRKGASGYLAKPGDLHGLREVLSRLDDWLGGGRA